MTRKIFKLCKNDAKIQILTITAIVRRCSCIAGALWSCGCCCRLRDIWRSADSDHDGVALIPANVFASSVDAVLVVFAIVIPLTFVDVSASPSVFVE